jgi:NAD(P)-dependent dehydrogenase (short-subunit alcohol dehydrogenase family)
LKSMKENNGKDVVVITGASAGAGRAIALEFGRHGARVALIARGEERLEDAKREIEGLGGQALTFSADVADARELDWVASQVEENWGPIDVWVNNAMVGVLSPVKEMEPEEYKRVTEVTYLGQVYGTQAALKRMLPGNKGSIVLVGSALAYRGIPLQSAYCGAKHAIMGFYDSLRAELLHDKSKVTVTTVQLPAMNTPQFDWMRNKMPNKPRPMGTIFQPEAAARTVYYAAYHPEREYKVGFPTMQAIIGNKLLPMVGDWVLARNGFEGQQTDEPAGKDRLDNLFEPAPGLFGAHGRFDSTAKKTSWVGQLGRHQKLPAVAAVLAGILTAGFFMRR